MLLYETTCMTLTDIKLRKKIMSDTNDYPLCDPNYMKFKGRQN
jgi:hypothetical protein